MNQKSFKMCALKISILLLFCVSLSYQKHSNASFQATLEVVDEIFIKNSLEFDLLIFGETSSNLNKISDGILRSVEGRIGVEVGHIKDYLSFSAGVTKSAVILVKDLTFAFFMFERFNLANDLKKELKFLIYIEEENGKEIFKILPKRVPTFYYPGRLQDFSYFLIESKNFLELKTIEWFTEKLCDKSQIVKLNEFNKKSRKWTKIMKIPQKYKNFHNCTISVLIIFPYESFYDEYYDRLEGFSADLTRALGKFGNFTPFFSPVPENL